MNTETIKQIGVRNNSNVYEYKNVGADAVHIDFPSGETLLDKSEEWDKKFYDLEHGENTAIQGIAINDEILQPLEGGIIKLKKDLTVQRESENFVTSKAVYALFDSIVNGDEEEY